jgi:uncharacterized membrane protein YidH (DUF202 family)
MLFTILGVFFGCLLSQFIIKIANVQQGRTSYFPSEAECLTVFLIIVGGCMGAAVGTTLLFTKQYPFIF